MKSMDKPLPEAPASREAVSGSLSGHPVVVGIGASAGGLEALEQFFSAVSPASGLIFVVVQHMAPDKKSALAELL
jgi:two-component system CheB/CheR fusion protein